MTKANLEDGRATTLNLKGVAVVSRGKCRWKVGGDMFDH